MNKTNDIIQQFWELSNNDLEHIYPVLQFIYDSRLKKDTGHFDITNITLQVLISQLFRRDDSSLQNITASLANSTVMYLTEQYYTKKDPNSTDIINILKTHNFFVLCGRIQAIIKNDREIQIKIHECRFERNRVCCNFTQKFLRNMFGFLFKNQMVLPREIQAGEGFEVCTFRFDIKPFKHIKILDLR